MKRIVSVIFYFGIQLKFLNTQILIGFLLKQKLGNIKLFI